jgi:hypothetical protein
MLYRLRGGLPSLTSAGVAGLARARGAALGASCSVLERIWCMVSAVQLIDELLDRS